MIVHILRNSRITFCGLDAAFVRNVVRTTTYSESPPL